MLHKKLKIIQGVTHCHVLKFNECYCVVCFQLLEKFYFGRDITLSNSGKF